MASRSYPLRVTLGLLLCLGATWGARPVVRAETAEARPIGQDAQDEDAEADVDIDTARTVIEQTCLRCHNDRTRQGDMSLASFDVARAADDPELAERLVRKLRAGLMPPAGVSRPAEEQLSLLAEVLETHLDARAASDPDPGHRSFQRLNRAEYERSIRSLLSLELDAGRYLPLDTKSANFDNIADVQLLSTTLMNGYLRAASEVSRLAMGDPNARPSETTYKVTRWASQTDHIEGTPYGTRGGVSVVHNFPADGDYVFRVSFHHETTGAMFGNGRGALHTAERPEQVEISVDGERVELLDINRWMHVSDPDGVNIWTDPVRVVAGPHRVSAAFLRQLEGPAQDLISPHEWSLSSTSVADAYGFTSLPHLRDLAVRGPFEVTGVSETPSRRLIFSCRPRSAAQERPCAEEILTRLGSRAYRRPLTTVNLERLMVLYDAGARDGGFESGVRMALEGMLASPHFVFRFEEPPVDADLDRGYAVNDLDLASRLSFFLWAAGPDSELIEIADSGQLSNPDVLEQQVRRMLVDPRSDALASRFAGQWLRLSDLEKIHPDVRVYPDFDDQLKAAMLRETELFFDSLVREDRSVLDLFTADYTFVNERLARHYGLPDIAGPVFRRVTHQDPDRRGILGHGSVLTLTSHAGRTSPVLRGKWVMEVLIGTPPPPPPPNVPDLEETAEAEDGRLLSVRERLEQHRANPACASCHRMIDPLGMALENYDVTGAWRIKDNGVPIDASGELYDGSLLGSPRDLRRALLARPTPLLRTFTENLMAYALGRRLGYADMPTVRSIVESAARDDYKISRFILGVVESPAFQMNRGSARPVE